MRVTKSKQKQISQKGLEIMNAKDENALAFDQIKNIVISSGTISKFKDHQGILNYRKLIMSTVRNKDHDLKRQYIHNHCEPFRKLYNAYREAILEEDFGFLTAKDQEVNLTTGKSKTAILPLSAIYKFLQRDDEDKMADLEAKLLFCFKHLSAEDSEDRKILTKICNEYELHEDQSTNATISGIVNSVKGNMGSIQGKEPTLDNIAPLVQSIMGTPDAQNGLANLAKGIISGEMDIPTLINQVKKASEGNAQEDEEEEDSSE